MVLYVELAPKTELDFSFLNIVLLKKHQSAIIIYSLR